ncbi:hypothetical protein DFH27DRAFT_48982 [Peziza echinospora]|nr:hypothetical protein DFH27DRAFT_48982 [Peziza echinospora]
MTNRQKKQRKLVITFESYSAQAIQSQANLLPIPDASSSSQIICLPPIVLSPSSSVSPQHSKLSPKDIDQTLITQLSDLPEATVGYILSLREKWLKRLGLCNEILTEEDRISGNNRTGVEKVIFMLGGVTGVRFACIRRISEDVTAGDYFLAKEIFERLERSWGEKNTINREGNTTAKSHHNSRISKNVREPASAITLRSRCDTPTPIISAKGTRTTLSKARKTSRWEERRERGLASDSDTTYSRSSFSDEEPLQVPRTRGRPLPLAERRARPASPPATPPHSRNQMQVPGQGDNSRRPTSLIVLPNSSTVTVSPDSQPSPYIHTTPSLTDLRRRSALMEGISWFESLEKASRSASGRKTSEDSALAALIERSLSIKKPTESAYYTCTTSSNASSRTTTASTNGSRSQISLVESEASGTERMGSVSPELERNPGRNKGNHGMRPRKALRSSWLAPPTAAEEDKITEFEIVEKENESDAPAKEQKSKELFPGLQSYLEEVMELNRDWHESLIYLESETPQMSVDRIIFERLFFSSESAPVTPSFSLEGHTRLGHHRTPSPSRSLDSPAPISSIPEPQRRASWGGAFLAPPPIRFVANTRRVKLIGKGNKRKNDLDIQNEVRALVREIIEAEKSSSYPSPEEESAIQDYGEDDENDVGEGADCIWRDMFSTKGQWPVSRINMIVALGREGPTDKVKGGSARVLSEAMARRIESWDLRCRRISLRYLLGVEKLSSALKRHAGSSIYEADPEKQPQLSTPRQLLAELEFFLSQHEPTDVLLVEFNTNSRLEAEAVLELGRILGHSTEQNNFEPEKHDMLRIISVIDGEIPKGLEASGIVVGSSKISMIGPPPKSKRDQRKRDSQFEEFRFPSCRPGEEPKKEPKRPWKNALVRVSDLVVEDTNNDRHRKPAGQTIPLESQLDHIYSVLDHWNVVAKLIPPPAWQPNRLSSHTQAPLSPFDFHQHFQHPDSKSPLFNHSLLATSNRSRSRPQTLLKVIVTAHSDISSNDEDGFRSMQNSESLKTTREELCPSPRSIGTFLEDAGDESSDDDDFDTNINSFKPSVGVVDAHDELFHDNQAPRKAKTGKFIGDEDDLGDADDYDVVVAMQYASNHNRRNSKSLKPRRRKGQIWFRRMRPENATDNVAFPAIKRMTIMRVGGATGGKPGHSRTGSKSKGLVLVSHKAMKLLGLECTFG